jgi:hypothetical protein
MPDALCTKKREAFLLVGSDSSMIYWHMLQSSKSIGVNVENGMG